MRKFHLILILTAVLLSVGSSGAEREANAAPAVRVVVMQPKPMEFVQKILVQGNVETKEKVEISSRVSGTIDFMGPGEGDMVKKGDTLFQVDRVKLENDVKGQKHKLSVAEAELKIAEINGDLARKVAEKAQADFNRSEQLRKAEAVSEDAHERVLLSLREAEAGVLKADAQTNYARAKVGQAQAELEIAQKSLADSRSRSPLSGRVVTKKKDPGEFVNTGEMLYRIEDPDRLEVVMMISAVYYDQIVPGKTEAVIHNRDNSVTAGGVVRFRSPAIDALSRTFTVKVDLPVKAGFVSGQLCRVDLILRKVAGVGVPNTAILDRRNNRRTLFVVREGRAESVDVETGIVDGAWTMLTDPGVLKGSPVIVEGQAFLEAGEKVEAVPAAAEEAK